MSVLFANFAGSTLASPIAPGDLTATLTSGGGSLFPSPGAGQYFSMTFANTAATLREIVHVTARSGDVLTIVRAQEGTTALGWNAGDLAQNRLTAGDLAYLEGLFSQVPIGFASSQTNLSANTTITIAYDGNFINAGSGTTMTLVAASTVPAMSVGFFPIGACTVVSAGGNIACDTITTTSLNLSGGQFLCVQSDGTSWRVFAASPGLLGYASKPVGGDLAGTLPNPTIKASVNLTGNPTAATQTVGDSSSKLATTGFVNPASLFATIGFNGFSSGFYLQWMAVSATPGLATFALPEPFATACLGVMISFQASIPPTGQSVGAEIISGDPSNVKVYNTDSVNHSCNVWALGH